MMGLYRNTRIYDAFVSATMKDLKSHRQAAIEAIRDLGHRAVGMEHFGARSELAKQFIFECISDCDFFVLILGRNAGSIVDGKPYVSLEYEHAVRLKKPILAFAIKEDEVRGLEQNESALAFRDLVLSSGSLIGWYSFDNLDDLKSQISSAVDAQADQMESRNIGGWIRHEGLDKYVLRSLIPSPLLNSDTLLSSVNSLSHMDGLVSNFDKFQIEKEAACDHLIHRISVSLSAPRGINRLFIDGGSTTFHFCRKLNEYCKENGPFLHYSDRKRLVIGTNSLFNFIELSLGAPQGKRTFRSLRLYPAPPVDKTYGKSFGDFANVHSESEYSYEQSGWKLAETAEKHVKSSILEFQNWLDHEGGRNLIVMSCAAFIPNGERAGPWVKDHSSMLQQQSIYRSQRPIALLIDPDKWDKRLGKHDGYPVLFDQASWEELSRDSPLAVFVSTTAAELAGEIEEYFRKIGMKVVHEVKSHPVDDKDIFSLMAFTPSFEPLIVRSI